MPMPGHRPKSTEVKAWRPCLAADHDHLIFTVKAVRMCGQAKADAVNVAKGVRRTYARRADWIAK